MPIRALIFDIGGVLETTLATGWEARWARRVGATWATGMDELQPVFHAGRVGEHSLDEVRAAMSSVLDLDGATVDQLLEEIWAEYLGTLNAELTDYFSKLRPRYRTALLSNSFVGARERERAAYGFEERCDLIVYSHEEGIEKPDPRIYRIAAARLGVAPRDVVFVDDQPACLEGARAVGMLTVLFLNNAQVIETLDKLLDPGE